jgi:hypothetical protein
VTGYLIPCKYPVTETGIKFPVTERGSTVEKKRLLIVIIAGVGIIGSFMPWASVFGMNLAGTEDGGWLTIVLFAIGGAIAFTRGNRSEPIAKNMMPAVWGSAGVALVVALVKIFRDFGPADRGFGLWLVLLAAIAQLVVALYYKGAAGWDLPDKVADVVKSTGIKLEEAPKADSEDKDEPGV